MLHLVFSYNRALQLDAYLRSFLDRSKMGPLKTVVLYHTSENHKQSYHELERKYQDRACLFVARNNNSKTSMLEELPALVNYRNLYRYVKYPYLRTHDNFRSLVLELIKEGGDDLVMFGTDDTYWYRDVRLPHEIVEKLKSEPSQTSVRYFLGMNLTDRPSLHPISKEFYSWCYYAQDSSGNWAYPFSVDGTIYEADYLYWLLKRYIFNMPSTLESIIVSEVKRERLYANGICPEKSCLVNMHINQVQQLIDNRAGNLGPDVLLQYFMDGYSLEYDIAHNISVWDYRPAFVRLNREGMALTIPVSYATIS